MITNPSIQSSGSSEDVVQFIEDFLTKNGKHVILNGAQKVSINCDDSSALYEQAFHIIAPEEEFIFAINGDMAELMQNLYSSDGSVAINCVSRGEGVVENYNPAQSVEVYVWVDSPFEVNINE